MRETMALHALSIVEEYTAANEAAQNSHMLVYVTEAALFLAAKNDESGLKVSFADFHRVITDLPSFCYLL